jgi:hypothetical protein
MEVKVKLAILMALSILATVGFCVALVWATKKVEREALEKKRQEREAIDSATSE